MKDPYSGVRGKAVEALVKIGRPAVEPLIRVLNDADSKVRREAAELPGAAFQEWQRFLDYSQNRSP